MSAADGFQFKEVDGCLRLSVWIDGQELSIQAGFTALDLRPGSPDLSSRQPLARALGKYRTVIDATAGLAHDAWLMACMGYHVTAVEQSAELIRMAQYALDAIVPDSAEAKAVDDRLKLIHGDAVDFLANLSEKPDVVYIDPMFPPKRRSSALPRKEIQLIRALVGDGGDPYRVLQAALKTAKHRVVVKRPHYADHLGEKPHHTINSKLLRYDVYQQ